MVRLCLSKVIYIRPDHTIPHNNIPQHIVVCWKAAFLEDCNNFGEYELAKICGIVADIYLPVTYSEPYDWQLGTWTWCKQTHHVFAVHRGRINGVDDLNSLNLLPHKMKTELAIHIHLDTLKKVRCLLTIYYQPVTNQLSFHHYYYYHHHLTSPSVLYHQLSSPSVLHDHLTSSSVLHDHLTSPSVLHDHLTLPSALHHNLTSPSVLHDNLTSPLVFHHHLTSLLVLH